MTRLEVARRGRKWRPRGPASHGRARPSPLPPALTGARGTGGQHGSPGSPRNRAGGLGAGVRCRRPRARLDLAREQEELPLDPLLKLALKGRESTVRIKALTRLSERGGQDPRVRDPRRHRGGARPGHARSADGGNALQRARGQLNESRRLGDDELPDGPAVAAASGPRNAPWRCRRGEAEANGGG